MVLGLDFSEKIDREGTGTGGKGGPSKGALGADNLLLFLGEFPGSLYIVLRGLASTWLGDFIHLLFMVVFL